jgi:hypothetical protein
MTLDYHPTRSVIFYGSMIAALAALESASVLELDIEPMQRSPWAR